MDTKYTSNDNRLYWFNLCYVKTQSSPASFITHHISGGSFFYSVVRQKGFNLTPTQIYDVLKALDFTFCIRVDFYLCTCSCFRYKHICGSKYCQFLGSYTMECVSIEPSGGTVGKFIRKQFTYIVETHRITCRNVSVFPIIPERVHVCLCIIITYRPYTYLILYN